jgi:hypothetical protein
VNVNRTTNLLEIKTALRTLPKQSRSRIALDSASLAEGYFNLVESAPKRLHGYLSESRAGVLSSATRSNRSEEHLAIALRNRGHLVLPRGERLRILDYQFPLKSAHSDAGIGKIDLLGRYADETLAVVEIKLADNSEDRRIALIEGLIYAALVEANIGKITAEINAKRCFKTRCVRPRVLLVGLRGFWTAPNAFPNVEVMIQLVTDVSAAVSTPISILTLNDAELAAPNHDHQRPVVQGHAFLSAVGQPADHSAQPATGVDQTSYLDSLFKTFWSYRRSAFVGRTYFREADTEGRGPPVFTPEHADSNVLIPLGAAPDAIAAIVGALPRRARHKWFSSIRSSQALAQSVFAGLREIGHLHALEGLLAEDGRPAFFESAAGMRLDFEREMTTMNEPRPTSVDIFLDGPHRVAVEVKFSEDQFGCCSRPRLTTESPDFARDYCDGTYTVQRGRSDRCSLSEQGIKYWQYLPRLFDWPIGVDLLPCPLVSIYQLARNLLAVTVTAEGSLETTHGHVLVVYDNRNPAFHTGGTADMQWWAAVTHLLFPQLLRRISWQRIIGHLINCKSVAWLTDGLRDKYGLVATEDGLACD